VPTENVVADGDSQLAFIDPDDGANRYDASFLPGGGTIVCVSDAGGVPNLEIIHVDTHASRPLTRVPNAVFAPAPNPADSSVFFLALHARGVDVRRVSLKGDGPGHTVVLSPVLAPAVPTPVERADTFERGPRGRPRAYGAGPHQHRLLPGGNYSTEGGYASLSLIGIDPVGRFAYALNAAVGERSTWRGASVTASWRGSGAIVPGAMSIDGTVFHAVQRPSEQRAYGDVRPIFGSLFDATYSGATMSTTTTRDYGLATLRLRIGATLGTLERPTVDHAVRGLVFGEGRGAVRMRRAGYRADFVATAHASRGGTDELSWARAIGTVTADVATPFGGGRIEALLGGSDGGGGVFERFVIGGGPTPLVDAPALAQRIVMPALPVGFAIGTHVKTLRASTALGPVRPFYWIGTTRENLMDWARVAGVDVDYAVAAFPAFAVPAVSIRAGAAYSWDAPFRHRVGVYAGVSYRP
jgi:hypothetical protein